MTNRSRPGVYEFFAGGGLAGLGLDGFEVLFANDLDAAKARSWRANHDAGRFHLGDVNALAPDDLPGRAALAWASSPCQDLSLAGARAGLSGARSGAFWGFWRLMQGLDAQGRAPDTLVVENVSGLLTSNHGRDFAEICGAFAEAGYRVGALEMDAALWTPQSRPRLFIVASRAPTAASFVASDPVAPFHTPRLAALASGLPEPVRAAWAWWALTPPPRRNLDLAAVLEPQDRVAWLDADQTAALLDLCAPLHRQRLDRLAADPELRMGAAYRRVRMERGQRRQRLEARFDGLAGCLRTPAGGSSRQYVLACGRGRVRARRLTGREAARLMGVPDAYVLPSSETAALKLMGDAVAVPVVRALSDQLLAPLAGSGRPSPNAD